MHRHYTEAFARPSERQGPWVLARELVGSSDWYESLWQRRERIAGKRALILWGAKDPAFGTDVLARWQGELSAAHTIGLPEVGHFVQEEAAEEAAREIRRFLAGPGAESGRPEPPTLPADRRR